MQILKKNGLNETYNKQKLFDSIKFAFNGVDVFPTEIQVFDLVDLVYSKFIDIGSEISTRQIRDLVKFSLIDLGYPSVAECYISFIKDDNYLNSIDGIVEYFDNKEVIKEELLKIKKDFPSKYSLSSLYSKFSVFVRSNMKQSEIFDMLVKSAVELVDDKFPKWEFVAARLLRIKFLSEIETNVKKQNIYDFYDKLKFLTSSNLYGSYILDNYDKNEIEEAYKLIDNSRDYLINYSGFDLFIKRYTIKDHSGNYLETIQEMFLGVALHLAMPEKKDRLLWVKRFYDMLSLLKVSMATPTLSNARKPFHQLSSCFIDTVPDSLNGIFRSIDNFAKVSKHGGGMGLYFGKVRAKGSSIRGFKGAAGGVLRWIRIVNDTAVAVDQLGMRQGACAVYLDVWHKDLPEFLQIRTNNGDDRLKAHDIFPAICYPDLFWRLVDEDINANWYLMCPHEIKTVKGYNLEDFWGEEWEEKYKSCIEDDRIEKRIIPIKEIIRLIIKSAVETGTPFTFNRDAVNRANPNKHQGIIYCSNLCTEIAQNMAPIEEIDEIITTKDGDNIVVSSTKAGKFVVCNLASLTLGRINVDDENELKDIIFSVVRALDNVIDLNYYPLPYAKITNKDYRAIGLGVSGYHHLLAKHNISWESEEHLAFVDKLFEKINYYAISASNEIAKEKGSYSCFKGSDWESGKYFAIRNYNSENWKKLQDSIKKDGLRNAYILSVAPTGSTSILTGTTAGVDPLMNLYFLEEKKNGVIPRVAPDLSSHTRWFYKSAHLIDQSWSIKANAVRQRHIDQAQSMNLYITNDYTFREILDLYLLAYKKGVKTLYYTRSKSLELIECVSCSS